MLWAILGVLSLLLGIFWLVDGIGLIVSAVEHRGMPGRPLSLSLLSGVLGIIAGLVLLFWPAISILTLSVLVGSLAAQLRRS